MFPHISAAVRIFLCTRPTDMRKGFDQLVAAVREFLDQDPLSGHLFLFFNRRRDRAKILFWDRDGLVIWYKSPDPDYPPPCSFTATGRHAHNLAGRPDEAGVMDRSPPPGGPRRLLMSRCATVIAPPRACPSSGRRCSTGCGVS